MDQIVVILEEGTNISVIKNTIKMIRGVKNAIVSHIDADRDHTKNLARLKALDQLAGCVSIENIDVEDERTKYILGK